jgi:lauroyl/myristoyl acyltransferase
MINHFFYQRALFVSLWVREVRWLFLWRAIAVLVPYSSGVHVNKWWSKRVWVQNIFYRDSVIRFERFLDSLPSHSNRAILLNRHFAGSAMRLWRLASLARMRDQEFWRWIRVEGWENFRLAAIEGKGVLLLNSHTHVGQIVPLLLAKKGFTVHTVGNNNRKYQLMALKDPRDSTIARPRSWSDIALSNMFIQHLQHARKALIGGAIVQIVPDGFNGQGGVQVDVLNRPYTFRLGFAELIDMTGAIAVPVLATIDACDHIVIRFFPQLKTAWPASNKRERLRYLISSYSSVFESNLVNHPEQFTRGLIARLVSSVDTHQPE